MLTPYDAVSDIFISIINDITMTIAEIIREILDGLNIQNIKYMEENNE